MNRSLASFVVILIAVVAIAGLGSSSVVAPAAAQTSSPSSTPTPTGSPAPTVTHKLSGWAWSSNIGWISFNSTDSGAGGGPYNVYVTPAGDIKGYAWSPNIGWIKFGDLSGFPVVASGNAHVSTSTGVVTGWARACAGTASGRCSTMTPRSDGWDGWIELSGVNHLSTATAPSPTASPSASPTSTATPSPTPGSAGVWFDKTTGQFKGFAWGGDVVGWMQWSPAVASVPPVTCPDCDGPSAIPLTASCSPAPGTDLTIESLPSSVSFNITAYGGAGNYRYVAWYNYQPGSLESPFPYNSGTITFGLSTPNHSSYIPAVVVVDGANYSSVAYCQRVTVNVPTPTSPQVQLWFDGKKPTTLGGWVGQTLRVKAGSDVKVGYNWTPENLICNGARINSPDGWVETTNHTEWLQTKDLGTKSFIFTNVEKGTYSVYIKCSTPPTGQRNSWLTDIWHSITSTAIAQTSNPINSYPITITVYKSSIEEI